MKKKLAVWGGRFFQGIVYNEDSKSYQYTANDCLKEIEEKYEVVNFSMRNMNVDKAFNYIGKSLQIDNYDFVLLALGDYEVKHLFESAFTMTNLLISKNSFKMTLEEIICLLMDAKIKPIMVTLQPSDLLCIANENEDFDVIYDGYNGVIIDLAIKYKLKLIDSSHYYRDGCNGNVKFVTNQKAQKNLSEALVREI